MRTVTATVTSKVTIYITNDEMTPTEALNELDFWPETDDDYGIEVADFEVLDYDSVRVRE
jgi:hypothetical protein